MSAVNGDSRYFDGGNRAERCNTVKYFTERKKMNITQLSQVMSSEIKFKSSTHPPTLEKCLHDNCKVGFFPARS